MTTGRPLTPEEQQRLARRERTLKNRRGRRNPAVMPDRLARTSAFVPRKVNLITDSNFTRVYECGLLGRRGEGARAGQPAPRRDLRPVSPEARKGLHA